MSKPIALLPRHYLTVASTRSKATKAMEPPLRYSPLGEIRLNLSFYRKCLFEHVQNRLPSSRPWCTLKLNMFKNERFQS